MPTLPGGAEPIDPDVVPPRTPLAAVVVAVFVGGLLGGLAREGLTDAWPGGTIPWAVLLINVVGSFVLGAVAELASRRMVHRHPVLVVRVGRPLLGTGFCGGFTTFSSLAVALDTLTRDGRPGAAALYLVLSLVLGLAAVVAGSSIARAVS